MKISKSKFELLMACNCMTALALSAKTGICPQTISTIRHRGTCAPQTAAKLAAGLGVDVAEIVGQK